jgi:transcriptional regulator
MYTGNLEATVRHRMIAFLEQGPATALEISQAIRIGEKEVYEHLPHIERSMVAKGEKLRIHQPKCLKCGFLFAERKRFRPPGRCPDCKSSYLSKPAYEIIPR